MCLQGKLIGKGDKDKCKSMKNCHWTSCLSGTCLLFESCNRIIPYPKIQTSQKLCGGKFKFAFTQRLCF